MATQKLSVPEFRAKLMESPSLFAHDVDLSRDAMLFIRLTEQDYRTASFLDNRIIRGDMTGAWFRLAIVSQTIAADTSASPHPHYIFHSGHVGSTLLSRLLDAVPGVLGIREPLILRTLARARDETEDAGLGANEINRLLTEQTYLWRRRFSSDGVCVVKATSSAARVGSTLLGANDGARAICLNVNLETYITTCLAGENTPMDLSGHQPGRQRRLRRMLGASPPVQTLGEQAALAWVTESLTHRMLAEEFGERVLLVDFGDLLEDTSSTLKRICRHLGLNPPESFFAPSALRPILHRYAKAPEAAYSPAERASRLARARENHLADIRGGISWAERLARSSEHVRWLL